MGRPIDAYKIVTTEFKTLYYAIEGSRRLKCDTWLKADKKMVVDGSGSKEYLSGIHVFDSEEKAKEYITKFIIRNNKVIIPCKAKNVRQKPTNEDVLLADEIYISQDDVEFVNPLIELKNIQLYIQCVICNEMYPIEKADYHPVWGVSMSEQDNIAECRCGSVHFIVGFEMDE